MGNKRGFIPLVIGTAVIGGKLVKKAAPGVKKTFDIVSKSETTTGIVKSIFNECKHAFIYTINISNSLYYQADLLSKTFKNIPDIIEWNISIRETTPVVDIHSISDSLLEENMDFVDYGIIDGIPVRIKIHFGTAGEYESSRLIKTAYIETPRFNNYPDRLKEVLREGIKAGFKKDREKNRKDIVLVSELNRNHSGCQWVDDYVPRNFDNVFMTSDIIDSIKIGIDKFVESADWYTEHALPYHYGIMLYGAPGMGKTSLAQAIATHMNSRLYVISGDEILRLPTLLNEQIKSSRLCKGEYNIVLIEDIDCGFAATALNDRGLGYSYEYDDDDMKKNVKKKVGLASVLNCIDGIGAPQNTVYIFTTNHIEKLDPALIRPGRIDLSLEIPSVNNEIFEKFMEHHFSDYKIPKTLKIKDGVSCASLQVMVMEGKTADEIIEFVSNSKSKRKSKSDKPYSVYVDTTQV